jgi:hypothetical protein
MPANLKGKADFQYLHADGVDNDERNQCGTPCEGIAQTETWHQPAVIGDWLRSCPVVDAEMPCGELAYLFRQRTELECAVVCDSLRKPIGLVMKYGFFRRDRAQHHGAAHHQPDQRRFAERRAR